MLGPIDQYIASLEQADDATPPPDLGDLAPLCLALAGGPEPRESLLRLRALVQATAVEPPAWPREGRALQAVAAVLSSGPDLGRILTRGPHRLALLLAPSLGRPWSRDELARALDQQLAGEDPQDDAALAATLTRFRNDQVLRLAACEFIEVSLEQVGLELSHLADLCLDRAMAGVLRALEQRHGPAPCGIAAIALGKHGALELNFCSDIDVVFIYASDDERGAGELTPNEFFSRLCQRVARMLSEPNPEGLCFRVDLRLRPEGSRGPVCNALAGAERYYETWGGPWDRLAWLKARPAAGDLDLGGEMVALMRPFVFPAATGPEITEQLQELNRRIQAQSRAASGDWNVKLHAGGIREVEFFVQSLQLLHAGKQPRLQVGATLTALERLIFCGLIDEQERVALAEAYQLWRRIEHRLQLRAGRQTHTLPGDGPTRRWLSGHLGMSAEALSREVARRRARVSAIYATLAGDAGALPEVAALLDPELPTVDAVRLLGDAGFAQPERAADQLQMLGDKPWGPLGRSPSAAEARLGPALLQELSRCPDPDAALHHLVQLSLGTGPYRGVWRMLEENRPSLRLLISLFGSSDYLARLFISHPELMDQLLMAGRAEPRISRADLEAQLHRRLERFDPDDEEGRLNALRRVRNEHVLRVGLHDIAGELALDEVWAQLSDLAAALLDRALPMALDAAARRYGLPRQPDGAPAAMCVVGLGKLGGRELTYASDLDLIFIHGGGSLSDGPRQVDPAEFFARVAQRLISALSATMQDGQLYQVDTRLRPSGNQGTLVTTLEALDAYHRDRAQLWERQVLLKARPVAGDAALGARVARWLERQASRPVADPMAARQEIHRLRLRLEQENAGERPGFVNLKLGRGGLLDVEFIVQYLQLVHAGDDACPHQRATLDALEGLAEAGALHREDAARLEQGYRFLRLLESRLRVVRDRSAERLPTDAAALEVMARRLSYREAGGQSAGQQLLAQYRRHTGAIREVYEAVLGADGAAVT